MEFEEFARVMADVYKRDFTDDEMRRAFQCFDTDSSGTELRGANTYRRLVVPLGYITTDELREVLRRMNQNITEKRMKEVLREIDTDQDGKISYAEFVHLLQLG